MHSEAESAHPGTRSFDWSQYFSLSEEPGRMAFVIGVTALVVAVIILATAVRMQLRLRRESERRTSKADNRSKDCSKTRQARLCIPMTALPSSLSRIHMDVARSRSSSGSTEREEAADHHHVPFHMYTNTTGFPVRTRLVQPCSRRRHSASPERLASPAEQAAAVTVMFSLLTQKDSLPNTNVQLTLLRADRLNRPHIGSALSHSPSSGTNFVTEGLFARIYKKDQRMDADGRASERDKSESLIQTPIIRSPESTSIQFPSQTIDLMESDFPIRISLYDVDKNGVRFSLGHTIIRAVDETQFPAGEAVILTQDLLPTICAAMQRKSH